MFVEGEKKMIPLQRSGTVSLLRSERLPFGRFYKHTAPNGARNQQPYGENN